MTWFETLSRDEDTNLGLFHRWAVSPPRPLAPPTSLQVWRPVQAAAPRLAGWGAPLGLYCFPEQCSPEPEHCVCFLISFRPNIWQPVQLGCGILDQGMSVCKGFSLKVKSGQNRFSFQQTACSSDPDALFWSTGRRKKTVLNLNSWGS